MEQAQARLIIRHQGLRIRGRDRAGETGVHKGAITGAEDNQEWN